MACESKFVRQAEQAANCSTSATRFQHNRKNDSSLNILLASNFMEDSEAARAVSLQAQFQFPSYPYQTLQRGARCVVSVRAEDGELDRAPIDLCAVVDRSGSMRGSKLNLVKQAIKFMIQQLSSTDRLSIVSFDAQVQDTYGDACNMDFMTSGNKKVATACIDRIQAGGGTNLSAGLFRAVDHHQQQPLAPRSTSNAQSRVKSVFLFSDGISSVGLTNRTQLTTILTAMLHRPGSPNIHTFGFGNVYDVQTMSSISEEGKGQCMHIQDVEVIPAAFATALGSLMSIVSQNFELIIAPEEGVTIKDVDTSFKKSSLPDGSLVIDIGDLHAGEHKDLLVKLDLPEVPISSPHMPVLSLEARYVDITNACMETSQFAVTIARAATSLASQPCNSFVMQHVQRCRTINALQAASDMAAAGDLSSAKALLANTEAAVRQHPVNASSACYADDLRTTLNAFESRESYQSVGRLVSSSLGREHSRQQTSFVGSGRTPMYQSVTGQRLYKAVIEVEYESGGNQPSDSSDSGRTSDASECLQHKHGDTSKDRPKAQVRPPVNAKTTAHSNLHSNTTTVDYHQQGTASSGSKRKHGQFLSDPRQQSTQATQVLGYSTHKVQKGQK